MKRLSIARTAILCTSLLSAVSLLGWSGWSIVYPNDLEPNEPIADATTIAATATTIVLVLLSLFLKFMSMIWVELIWIGLLWIFWLVIGLVEIVIVPTSVALEGGSPLFNLEPKAFGQFLLSMFNSFFLFVYWVIVLTLTLHARRRGRQLWTSTIRDADFRAVRRHELDTPTPLRSPKPTVKSSV